MPRSQVPGLNFHDTGGFEGNVNPVKWIARKRASIFRDARVQAKQQRIVIKNAEGQGASFRHAWAAVNESDHLSSPFGDKVVRCEITSFNLHKQDAHSFRDSDTFLKKNVGSPLCFGHSSAASGGDVAFRKKRGAALSTLLRG